MKKRKEFGVQRTVCGCKKCVEPCTFIPGFLIPSDLRRMQKIMGGQDLFTWAESHLLASPGAVVVKDGEVFNIPTLVPAKGPDGIGCHWFKNNRCVIHKVSPFGCAFFSVCAATEPQLKLSNKGLVAINKEWHANGIYRQVWEHLDKKGLKSKGSAETRSLHKLRKLIEREKL